MSDTFAMRSDLLLAIEPDGKMDLLPKECLGRALRMEPNLPVFELKEIQTIDSKDRDVLKLCDISPE